MMKSKKGGFTLVELLAVIVILGILATIGVVVTSRYLTESRKKSYKIMSQTIYEATMNCITQGRCVAPGLGEQTEITTSTLIAYGYLEKLDNPKRGNKDCDGKVMIQNNSTKQGEYQKYKYSVSLTCEGVANNTLIWPDEKQKDTKLDNIKYITSSGSSGGEEKGEIICKRATKLHIDTCNNTNSRTYEHGKYCTNSYKVGDKIAYGKFGTKGILTTGDAFDCDVNGDGVFDSEKERFYYVSDLANNTNYAVLLYYNNVSNGQPNNTSYTTYSNISYLSKATQDGTKLPQGIHVRKVNDSYEIIKSYYICDSSSGVRCNYYNQEKTTTDNFSEVQGIVKSFRNSINNTFLTGPVVGKKELPTTSNWNKVVLYNNKRDIYDSSGKLLVRNFDYSGYAARLLTTQEVENGCGLSFDVEFRMCGHALRKGEANDELLKKCSFMLENTGYTNSNLINNYYLESYIDYASLVYESMPLTEANVSSKPEDYYMVIGATGPNLYEINGKMGSVTAYSIDSGVQFDSLDWYKIEARKGIRPAIEVAKKNIDY